MQFLRDLFHENTAVFWLAYIAFVLTAAVVATAVQPGGPF